MLAPSKPARLELCDPPSWPPIPGGHGPTNRHPANSCQLFTLHEGRPCLPEACLHLQGRSSGSGIFTLSSFSLHTDSQALEEFLSHSMGSVNAHPVEWLPTAACTAYLVGRAPGPNATHSFSMPCAAACGTPSAVVFNFCASFSAWRTGGSLDRPAPVSPANKPSTLLKTSRFSPALRIFVRPSPSTKNAHFLAVFLELVMAEARGPSGCCRAAYTEASRLIRARFLAALPEVFSEWKMGSRRLGYGRYFIADWGSFRWGWGRFCWLL